MRRNGNFPMMKSELVRSKWRSHLCFVYNWNLTHVDVPRTFHDLSPMELEIWYRGSLSPNASEFTLAALAINHTWFVDDFSSVMWKIVAINFLFPVSPDFPASFLWEFSFFPRERFSFSGRSIISSHNMLQTIIIHKSIRWNSLEFELPWAHEMKCDSRLFGRWSGAFWEINQKFHEAMEQPVICASRGCNFPKQLSQPPSQTTRVNVKQANTGANWNVLLANPN